MNDYQILLSKINFPENYTPIFLDIGCNIDSGLDDFTEIFFSYYPLSKCVAVEPIFYQNYEKKWNNDLRVKLIKKALYDFDGEKVLYVPSVFTESDTGLSSLYKREIFGERLQKNYVKVLTLETLFNDLNLTYIDYLKIDTEGSEFPILRGGENILKQQKINYIQVEYGGTYADAGYSLSDVINFLNEYNYQIVYKTTHYYMEEACGEILFKNINIKS